MRRWLSTLFALIACLVAMPAGAAPSLIAKPLGGSTPLTLLPDATGLAARFTVENAGTAPLKITAVRPRPGSGSVPRLPPSLTAVFEDGRAAGTLAPGELRTVVVRWTPRREQGPHEIHGQIQVEHDGGDPAVMTIAADRGQPFVVDHALSLMLALPLLGLLVLLGLRFARYQKLRNLRTIAAGVALAQLALGGLVVSSFEVALTRYHGGDGFQLIEAAPLLRGLGIQYLAGIDGISILPTLLVPLLLLAASLVAYSIDRRVIAFWCWMLVLEAGLIGVFVLLDLALWLVAWLITALAAISLVGGWSSAGRAGMRMAAYLAPASVLIALAVFLLSGNAGTSYLLDGSVAARTWAYPELLHAGFFQNALLSGASIKLAFAGVLIGFAIVLAVVPFHGWLVSALGSAPAPAGILLIGGLVPVGGYGLVRLGFGLLPEGALWASTTLGVLGVLGALWAALAATSERDLGRFVGYATAFHGGFVLLALSGMTGIGVQSALTLSTAQALAGSALLTVVGVLRDRVRSADTTRFGGLAFELPLLGALGAVAFLGSMAVPGTLAFIGQASAVIGAFPTHPALSLVALLAVVVSAAAHFSRYSQAFLGKVPESWRRSRFLEPHGGRFPALESRELAALGLAAVLVVLLGMWPKPLLRLTDSAALDYAERVRPAGPTQVAVQPTSTPDRLALIELN